jgi:nitrogen fixation protein FixH
MNWGWKISIFMGIYMIGIISVVWFSMTRDVNLVAEDYYQQELAYEEQITRQKNTELLLEKPTFTFSADRKLVILSFSTGVLPETGQVIFYRPSDFTLDRKFKLDLDETLQQGFATESLLPGLWKAKLMWEKDNKAYFQEFIIVI